MIPLLDDGDSKETRTIVVDRSNLLDFGLIDYL